MHAIGRGLTEYPISAEKVCGRVFGACRGEDVEDELERLASEITSNKTRLNGYICCVLAILPAYVFKGVVLVLKQCVRGLFLRAGCHLLIRGYLILDLHLRLNRAIREQSAAFSVDCIVDCDRQYIHMHNAIITVQHHCFNVGDGLAACRRALRGAV